MPERDRPSLAGLALKKPLLDRGKPVVSIDTAESALLGEAQSAQPVAEEPQAPVVAVAATAATAVPRTGPLDVLSNDNTEVQSSVLPNSRLKPRSREIKIAWTFKIPHELHQELSAVATHNDLTMSDIVIEAIQLHLPNFPHPRKPGRP